MIYPKGTPTQPEIISIALSKLDIRPDDIFADIGCGSGSVSISAAKLAKHVYAIDNRDEAIDATTSNLKRSGLNNVSVLKGEASSLLPGLEVDRAFIGGSQNIERVLEMVILKVPMFMISAVRLETVNSALEILKNSKKFRELLQIQISRGSELGGGTMLKNENPVFLILGGEEC